MEADGVRLFPICSKAKKSKIEKAEKRKVEQLKNREVTKPKVESLKEQKAQESGVREVPKSKQSARPKPVESKSKQAKTQFRNRRCGKLQITAKTNNTAHTRKDITSTSRKPKGREIEKH